MNIGRLVAVACLPFAVFACVYDDEPPRRLAPEQPEGNGAYQPAPPATGGGQTPSDPPASTTPMLVEVDTDQTMTADPGEGVGVFVEYATGGKWHIWWTCDTALTNQACDFSLSAAADTGEITGLDTTALAGGFATLATPSRVDASVVTRNEVHAIRFATDPGAVITLEASLAGQKDGSFLFFVQDGKVNGGFQGKVTNPLKLKGKTP
jgi:hypothetical protein